MRAPLTILSLVCAATLPLAGQQTSVTGVRPLSFGTVFPGVASVVSRTDPANSGQFDLKGHPGGTASLTFLLPAVMTGPAGATLPLVFGGSDGGFSASQSINNQRSEEHTSELQSRRDLVCRLLLEKKKKKYNIKTIIVHITH